MCYKCSICLHVSQPKEPLRKYVFYKNVMGLTQIAGEFPVCRACKKHLDSGTSFLDLKQSKVDKVSPPNTEPPKVKKAKVNKIKE